MKGPYDNELSWPLNGQFRIELLNQNSDSDHYSHTFQLNKDICYGCVQQVMGRNRSRYSWKVNFDNLFRVMVHQPSTRYVKENVFYIRIIYFPEIILCKPPPMKVSLNISLNLTSS